MDVLSFLQNGNVRPNPEYNPKTKKGKYQAPTLVDYNPGTSIIDRGRASIARIAAQNIYSLNSEDVEDYGDYGVYVNPVDTLEELNRERAENQSVLEQTSRMIGQAAVNEVVIGSFLGLSNLIDAGIQLFQEEGEKDFTNPASKFLEDAQNNIRKEWEIYRKDPNATWAITDTGWWADNMVSVMSTASMLLPTLGVSKTLSWAGKGLKLASKGTKAGEWLNRTSASYIGQKVASKYGQKFAALSDSGKIADYTRQGREILQNAFMSRTMEGYLEAREVYNQVQRDTLDRINNFNDEERAKFFENNPNLKDKSPEEIANYIASISANTTFKNDYAMLLMDAIQFKSLGELYTGGRKLSNASLALQTKKAKEKLLGIAKPDKRWTDSDFMFKAKYMATHPFEGFAALEWSEGIEEGYQGIQVEKGKEVAEKIFDPTFTPRDINSYLSDPAIYEQAFWGVIGALGFGGVGKGLKYLGNKLEPVTDKLLYDEKEVANRKLSEARQRRMNIEGWADNTESFIKTVNIIRENKNPFKMIKDAEGKETNAPLTDIEKETMMDKVINDYISDMAINATDRGNFDILESFLTDPEIAQHINTQTGSSQTTSAYQEMLKRKLSEVSDLYNRNTYNIRNTIHVENPFVGQAMARAMTRTQLNIRDFNERANAVDAQIADMLADDTNDYTTWEHKTFINWIADKFKEFDSIEQGYAKALVDNKLSQQAYDQYMSELNRKRLALTKFANDTVPALANYTFKDNVSTDETVENLQDFKFSELISAIYDKQSSKLNTSLLNKALKEFNNFLSQFQLSNEVAPNSAVQILMGRRAGIRYNIYDAESQLPATQAEYEEEYQAHARIIDKMVRTRHDTAVDNVLKWIKEQSDLKEARSKLYNNEVESLKEDLDLLKLGYESTAMFWSNVEIALGVEEAKRRAEEKRRNTVTQDGETLTPEDSAQIRADMERMEREADTNMDVPSTGQRTESNATDRSVTPTVAPTLQPAYNTQQQTDTERQLAEEAKREFDTMTQDEDEYRRQLEESIELMNDSYARSQRRSVGIVKNIYKTNPALFNNLTSDDIGTEKWNDVINKIADTINIDTGQSMANSINLANYALKVVLNLFGQKYNNNNLIKLASEIVVGARMSSVGIIEDINSTEDMAKLVTDFVNTYMDVKGIKSEKGINTTINLFRLYETIINDKDVDISLAIEFFTALQTFISDTSKRKLLPFKFMDIKKFNKVLQSPAHLIDTMNDIRNATEWNAKFQHVALSNSPYAREIARTIDRNTPIQVVVNPMIEVNGKMVRSRSISFQVNGREVGYMATVEKDPNNNTFRVNNTNGFRWVITDNGDGTYNADLMDTLFKDLFAEPEDRTDLTLAIRKALAAEYIDDGLVNEVLNSQIIKDMMEQGLIVFHKNDNYTAKEKVDKIIDTIRNIQTYNKHAELPFEFYGSYVAFKEKLYKNYQFAYHLQTDKVNEVRFVNTWDGAVEYGETNYDCNTRGFTAKNNPLVGVLPGNESHFTVEGSTTLYRNAPQFRAGAMGFMVRDAIAGPAIALITGSKPISSNAHISKLLKAEITELFNKYLDTTSNYEFEDILADLHALVSGKKFEKVPGLTTHKFTLFNGFSLVTNGDSLSLAIPDESGKPLYHVTINKYKYETKDRHYRIIYSETGKRQDAKAIRNISSKEEIQKVVDFIVNKLSFNATYFTLQNINAKNVPNSKYLSLNQHGQLEIQLGGKTLVYDSFTDFALKENIFTTNQEIVDGSYFAKDANNSLFIDAEGVHTPLPVKGRTYYDSLEDMIRVNSKSAINTADIFTTLAIDPKVASFLLGANEFGIQLVPEEVYYDSTLRKSDNAKFKDGKVYVGKAFAGFNNSKKNITVLIHEQIHKHFSELDDVNRTRILNELKDTYDYFIQSLERDINGTDETRKRIAENIKKQFIIEGNFTPENYGKNLNSKAKAKYNRKQNTGEAMQVFLEEWLAESLSQTALREYLNNTNYGNVQVDVSKPQTIFQKIISLLLQLFGINSKNINNNTILAKQFEILRDDVTTTSNQTTDAVQDTSTVTTPEVKTDDTVTTPTEVTPTEKTIGDTTNLKDTKDNIDTNQNIEKDNGASDSFLGMDVLDTTNDDYNEDDNTDDDYDYSAVPIVEETIEDKIDRFAENADLNANGFNIVTNMNSFLNKFKESDRADIQKALENGTIQYLCF